MENKEQERTRKPGTFTSENAREMQSRSVQVKLAKRSRREALEQALEESVRVMTEGGVVERSKGEQMMKGLLEKALDKDLEAIKLVLKVTGELTERHDVTSGGQPIVRNIIVQDAETKELMEELMQKGKENKQ